MYVKVLYCVFLWELEIVYFCQIYFYWIFQVEYYVFIGKDYKEEV